MLFFSISSHHPYTIPSDYKNKIPSGLTPVQQGMAYADASLRSFFEIAKKQKWYDETIFIITSDHSGPATTAYTYERLGAYHIPLVFINPQNTNGKIHPETAQQTDILPSALHLLNYAGNYTSLGRNLFKNEEGFIKTHAFIGAISPKNSGRFNFFKLSILFLALSLSIKSHFS